MAKPIIGITCDTVADHTPEKWKHESPCEYSHMVVAADGVPVLLPHEPSMIPHYLDLCDGIILSGGDDPDLSELGIKTHPEAKLMHIARQNFEFALLKALDTRPIPALGVCLGMQLMALHNGGRLHQHLPEAPGFNQERADRHQRKLHAIHLRIDPHPHIPGQGMIHSRHHQAVADPGSMRVVADYDEVIEAIDRPDDGRYYLGIQWHPECTADPVLGLGLIQRFVEACVSR